MLFGGRLVERPALKYRSVVAVLLTKGGEVVIAPREWAEMPTLHKYELGPTLVWVLLGCLVKHRGCFDFAAGGGGGRAKQRIAPGTSLNAAQAFDTETADA